MNVNTAADGVTMIGNAITAIIVVRALTVIATRSIIADTAVLVRRTTSYVTIAVTVLMSAVSVTQNAEDVTK